MELRILTQRDAADSRLLRLEALQTDPDAFLTTLEEERAYPVEKYRERLTAADSQTFGAFCNGELVGTATLKREVRPKTAHRAFLLAMYVSPRARGKGIGRRLVEALLAAAEEQGIGQVELAVVSDNQSAKALYLSAGFRTYGMLDNAMQSGGNFLTEEFMVKFLR